MIERQSEVEEKCEAGGKDTKKQRGRNRDGIEIEDCRKLNKNVATLRSTVHLPASGLGEDGSSSLKATGCLSHGVDRNDLRDESALKLKKCKP